MSLTTNKSNITIVGAGIGGLSAAIALQQIGHRVKVYEKAPELKETGAGIVLAANAIKVLEKLGAAGEVRLAGAPVKKAEILTSDGQLIINMPVHKQAERYGTYSYLIYRPDLQQILYQKLEPGTVVFNKTFYELGQDQKKISTFFETGEKIAADLLIGADGVHSRVRKEIVEDSPLRYSGFTAFRGISYFQDDRFPEELGGGFEAWGKGKRFGFSHLGKGRVFWFAAVNMPEGTQWGSENKKNIALQHFRGWWGPIEAVIDSTEESKILMHEIYDRKPVNTWHKKNAVLLGDAAHPMLPNLGQGGAQAMEDALILSRCLNENPGEMEHALCQYEQQRLQRTKDIVQSSRLMARLMQLENPAAIRIRNKLLRITPDELKIKRLDWVLGYEV